MVEPQGANGTSEATQQLGVFRERMLRMLVWVSLACIVPVNVVMAPLAIRQGNYLYLAYTWGAVATVVLVALLRRRLPLAVRAWMFVVPGLVHLSLSLPHVVDPLGMASAIACLMYVSALVGPRSGIVFGALILVVLGAGSYFAPWDIDPQMAVALRQGPLRPGVAAIGCVPMVAMVVAAVHIIIRGLVHGFDEALAGLRAAQQSDRQFRGVFESTPDPMVLIRLSDTTYVDVNPAFEQVFGWPGAEVRGRSVEQLTVLRAEDRTLLLRRVQEGQQPGELDLVAHRRDGQELNVVVTVRAAEVAGQRVALVVARDVTAQRRLESAVRHAQRIESTGALAGGIAHNFRNALGAILPNLDVCLEDAPESLHPALQDARAAASAAMDLARKLTRIARREVSSASGAVALGELLAEVAALCRSTFGARTEIQLEVVEDGTVLGDRGELHQAFLNLLLNARDAVEEVREPRISVRLGRSEDGGLQVSITDDGVGMDESTVRRLGEPFFTTKGEGKGTGLGITTAFAAFRAAGGRVAVTSSPGAGTTFTVVLPRSEAAPGAAPKVAVRLGGRALVVDDDRRVLEALGRQLGGLGIEAELVDDGPQALARLRENPGAYSLLVTDMEMPGMDGRALIEQAHAVAPALPALVITGSTRCDPVPGAQEVLAKPVSTVELAAAAARCLGVDPAVAA
jgi:PAS domain S-box-containing protein